MRQSDLESILHEHTRDLKRVTPIDVRAKRTTDTVEFLNGVLAGLGRQQDDMAAVLHSEGVPHPRFAEMLQIPVQRIDRVVTERQLTETDALAYRTSRADRLADPGAWRKRQPPSG